MNRTSGPSAFEAAHTLGRLLLTDEDAASGERALAGGKAAQLSVLRSMGLRVPGWLVLTTHAYELWRLADQPDQVPRDLAEILRRGMEGRWGEAASTMRFAVRSSAAGEDSGSSSFAGQFRTILGALGIDGVLAALPGVWGAAASEGVLAYARQRGVSREALRLAVVIQELVVPEASGVVFSAHPVTGDREEVVGRVGWGLGEGVVADLVPSDGFSERTGEVRYETADKESAVVLEPSGTTVLGPVDENRRLVRCLTDAEVRELACEARRIARLAGHPQDIEFARMADGWVFLQTRPVTTLEPGLPSSGRAEVHVGTLERLWDNSNIVESYNGVTTPLTFSFASQAYTIVYQQIAALLGVPPQTLQANAATFRNMIGFHSGRIYYNMRNWYRIVALLPGYEANKAFMEQMMGVKATAQVGADTARAGMLARFGPVLVVAGRLLWAYLTIDRRVSAFQHHFNQVYEAWRHKDWASMPPDALAEAYDELERSLLWRWQAPILTDTFAMVAYGLLRRLCDRWLPGADSSLQNDLLSGEGGIESTAPTHWLLRKAAELASQPERASALLAREAADVPAWVDQGDPVLASEVAGFLDRWGFRCMDELKLEEPTLKDEPSFVYAMLQNYLKLAAVGRLPSADAESDLRKAAEAEVRTRLRGRPLRAWLFFRVLGEARKHVRNRENLRFSRTRIFGVCRELFRAMGTHMTASGLLSRPGDVFYLTVPEVWAWAEGRAVTTDLKGLAALRARQFESWKTMEVPERFTTNGVPSLSRRDIARSERRAGPDDEGVLHGVSCCPGKVTAPVRLVLRPADAEGLAGQILTTVRTDPGWIPLYPASAGLLIERGSILSHSAIVAREMGLPAIVGIPGLSRAVMEGQTVTMDGRAGTVRLRDPAESCV
ncbi:MAG: PEP/pyruvate-binding domain-containing protein [Candidatus Sericytochromatia bacterium]|nr:PEP/pyruvate-binding domain-containing protein [Candidatus Sericytochromatia bacterium]